MGFVGDYVSENSPGGVSDLVTRPLAEEPSTGDRTVSVTGNRLDPLTGNVISGAVDPWEGFNTKVRKKKKGLFVPGTVPSFQGLDAIMASLGELLGGLTSKANPNKPVQSMSFKQVPLTPGLTDVPTGPVQFPLPMVNKMQSPYSALSVFDYNRNGVTHM